MYNGWDEELLIQMKLLGDFTLKLLYEGKIKTYIRKVIPLEQTKEALDEMRKGHGKGKIVIRF